MKAITEKYQIQNRSTLLDVLQNLYDKAGYLSEEAITNVSKQFGLATAKVYGIASFYDQFRFEPLGKYHIKICDGTSCHLSNSTAIIREIEKLLRIKPGQITRDGKFSIETVSCLGACGKSSIILINEDYYTEMTPLKTKELLENLNKSEF